MRTPIYLALGALLGAASVALAGPLPAPPAGYTVTTDEAMNLLRAQGIADGIGAEKPSPNWPNNCAPDPKLKLSYMWQISPGFGLVIEQMATAPEEPASPSRQGSRDEPAGKQRYLGGVLTWRKTTSQLVGVEGSGCKLKEIVEYNGNWLGFLGGKMVGVSVWHVYGDKAAGQALIDEYVPKVKAAVAAGK